MSGTINGFDYLNMEIGSELMPTPNSTRQSS